MCLRSFVWTMSYELLNHLQPNTHSHQDVLEGHQWKQWIVAFRVKAVDEVATSLFHSLLNKKKRKKKKWKKMELCSLHVLQRLNILQPDIVWRDMRHADVALTVFRLIQPPLDYCLSNYVWCLNSSHFRDMTLDDCLPYYVHVILR